MFVATPKCYSIVETPLDFDTWKHKMEVIQAEQISPSVICYNIIERLSCLPLKLTTKVTLQTEVGYPVMQQSRFAVSTNPDDLVEEVAKLTEEFDVWLWSVSQVEVENAERRAYIVRMVQAPKLVTTANSI